jgi:hypothetical protein
MAIAKLKVAVCLWGRMKIDTLIVRAVFLLGLNSWLQAQNPSFRYQAVETSTVTHDSVAVADLNRDGKSDLVIANYNDASVSVFLGRGDGTFVAETRYGVKSAPTSVAIADFNGDGTPDLAVASYGSSQVSVLLGNGDGTFRTAVGYASSAASSGIQPYTVAVGDFNGDGNLDLAVTNYSNIAVPFAAGATVSVLLGAGDGTFQRAVEFAAGSGPLSLAVADVNGDGYSDLVVANNFSNNVSILLGAGDGTFRDALTLDAGDRPSAVVVADFNGDGIPDLAVTNSFAGTISVLLGSGNGTFSERVTYPTDPYTDPFSLAVVDFNGDGKPDLAVAMWFCCDPSDPNALGTLNVLMGNGDGTFEPSLHFDRPSFIRHARSIVTADFNKDGQPDLAVVNETDISIFTNITAR